LAGVTDYPSHSICALTTAGDFDHRRSGIYPDQFVTALGKITGDQPGATAEVNNRLRADLCGKLRVKPRLRVGRVCVDCVIDRDQPWIAEFGDRY
jgi:hypothetical protein